MKPKLRQKRRGGYRLPLKLVRQANKAGNGKKIHAKRRYDNSTHYAYNAGKTTLHVEEYPDKLTGTGSDFFIVAYPKDESLLAMLRKASKSRAEEGPSDSNPAAIGTLALEQINSEGHIAVKYIQNHYKTKSNKAPKKEPGIYRRVHNDLAGWRVHALKEAISIALRNKQHLMFTSAYRRSALYEKIHEAAIKSGLEKKPDKHGTQIRYYKGNKLAIIII